MIQALPKKIPGVNKTNQKLKIAIVRSSYYPNFSKSLEKACRKHLVVSGINERNIETFAVPGSWEIPLIVKNIAQTRKFSGIVALGVIIKGDTYHFELIANECTRALMNLALEFNTPITFEVLTVYNLEQAKKRSMGNLNKGIEAAKSLLETIKIMSKI